MAKKKKLPDERKIKKYMKEDATFDPKSYRRAFYRTGEQLRRRNNGNDKKGLHSSS